MSRAHSAQHGAMVPRHVAIIMDGNGRWATRRHLPRVAGHSRGVDVARATIEACGRAGIEYLTLFAFSSENWRRPADEVATLMRLFVSALNKEVAKLRDNGIRLRIVGDIGAFDPELRAAIAAAERETAANTRMHLSVCASYGGRWDIMQAVRRILADDEITGRDPQTIDEAQVAQHLSMAFAPDPDLLIRTGGERRISNFLLWQLAYAELYFTDTLWPEFDAAELNTALSWFASRERRFGRTGEQMTVNSAPNSSAANS